MRSFSVFDMFMQVDRSTRRSQGGLGIGLTLVRRLVEMHGGRVEASSPGLGQGSEFVIHLPAHLPAEASLPAAEPAAPSPARPLRVLVVDDNVDAAESMSALLEIWGHEAHACHDGPTALKAVARLRPDTVLLDIGLPGMDGYEVLRQIRAFSDVPVVMLTALLDDMLDF